MRRLAHVLLLGLLALACGGLSATENPILFIGVSGYKLTERGELQPLANLPGLTVTPGEGHVYSNGDLAARSENNFAVTVPFGYRVGKWKIAFDDPFALTDGEDLAGSEGAAAVTIPWSGRGHVAYLALILEPDNNRTVTIGKTPFGAGTVGTNLGTYACQKGDVFRLNALPAHDDATGFDRSVFRRWKDGVTDARRTVTVDTNLTLIAEFVPNSWDVSFNANGGSVCPQSKRVTCDASYGWLPTPTRPGHSFVGWYSESLNGSRVVFDTTVGAIGGHSLYAHWDAASYVIGFELRGEGNGTVEGVGSFPYGTLTTLQAKPYEGSVFAGWEDGETRNPRRIDVTGDATYGARFDIATFDVSFTYRNAQGEWTVSPVQKVRYGEAAVPPDESAYDSWPEHHFRNWSTEDYKSVKSGLAGEHSVQAIYDVQTYKVMFVYRDRDGNAVTTMPQHVEAGKAAVPPKDDVANNWIGHTRTGWKPDYSVIGSDLTVTADYELRQYDVTFVYTDGSGKEAKTVEPVPFGETVPFEHVESLTTQWSGHTFKYWSLGNRPVMPPVVVSNNLHIAAVYEGYAHISYDANGAEGEMPTRVYTNFIGQVELASNAFTKTGYEFTHWSMDESTETFKDRAVVMLEDGSAYDLKANWAPISYTLHFDGNGGTFKRSHPPRTVTYDRSELVGEMADEDIDRDGYTLVGWEPDHVGVEAYYEWVAKSSLVVSNLTPVADDTVTFSAIWEAMEQTITIVDGTGEPREKKWRTGAQFTDPGKPQRDGYVFGGWTTNGADAVTFPIVVPPNGFTLTALWTPIAYSVRFHGNGGTGEMDDQAFVYDEAPKPLDQNAFEISGQTFNGWTNAIGKVYADGALVSNLTTNNGEIVGLWATWTPNRYTVKFLPGAGTGTMSDQDFRYDEPKALTSNGFTAPDRMVFDCWTNAAAQEAYADGAFVSNLTAVAGGVVELMALWKVAPSYIVAFRGEGGTNETGAASYEQTIECGKATALTANRFARTGYGFAGWAAGAGDGSTVVHTNGEFVTDLAAEGTTKDLYAAWTPNHFTVVFDGNGADDGSMEPQAFTYDVEQALTSNGFTRTGYTFANWTNETGDVYKDGAAVSNLTDEAGGEVTFFATWTPNRYEIRYDSAGGSAVNAQTNDCGAPVTAPTEPTKPGYAFDGWYEGESKTPFGFTTMPARDVALTAHWTPNGYTVRFLPGDGTGTMSDQDFRYDEPNALTPNGFTAPNQKIFDCWTNAAAQKTYADGALVSNLTTVANGVVELTALWKSAPSYVVAFKGAGGTNETGAARYEQRVECGKATALTANRFTRTGYGFAGWAAAEDSGSAVVYTNGEFVTDLAAEGATKDLYAAWTPNHYTVVFNGNGATSGEMVAQEFVYDVAQALTSNAFTKTGHTFACWTNEAATGMSPPRLADGKVVSNLTAEAGGVVTLSAKWTVNKYHLSFNGNGSGWDYDREIVPPSNPTKTGYVFDGWYADDGETKYEPGMRMPDRDLVFVSHWTPISYTIAFDANGGSGTMTNFPAVYDQEIVLPVCEYELKGYNFDQWTNETWGAKNPGDSIKNLTTTAGATVTFFVKWTDARSPLSQALGTDLEVTSTSDAWTVKGDKSGVERTSSGPSGSLCVVIPGPGTLSFAFTNTNGDPDNEMTFKFNGASFGKGILMSGNGLKTMTEAGTLEFCGTPDAGATWTLKNFHWEPAK